LVQHTFTCRALQGRQPFRDFLCGLRVLTFSIVALSQLRHVESAVC
jgi:hypothetical protein